MGNCQAAEAVAAAAVIEHPGGRVERVYWTVAASNVMAANPGHYVAVVVVAAPRSSASGNSSSSASPDGDGGSRAAAPVAHVKLLRPDDPLHIGRVYRLVTFEDVLKVFGSRRHVKLSKLIARQERKKKAKLQESDEGGGGNASNESSSETWSRRYLTMSGKFPRSADMWRVGLYLSPAADMSIPDSFKDGNTEHRAFVDRLCNAQQRMESEKERITVSSSKRRKRRCYDYLQIVEVWALEAICRALQKGELDQFAHHLYL
ncbi:uncharacterized protein LOC109716179 [Ananas comosus]|uniref:Uncharacterized protein LOC109716179 n=1 Tax=Ananas comosus TaxID=4615 RepID=A0A6P5FN76_ANACO|nr:uncharacterized protein LOC109716179 [Ananas comosus]